MSLFIKRSLNAFLSCSNFIKAVPNRNIFSPSALGIDLFKQQQIDREQQSINNIGLLKSRLNDSLTNEGTKIFSEDILTFLHLVKNDEDLNLFIQVFRKYVTDTNTLNNYHFGPPLMRLLYLMNKSDLSIELLNDESLKNFLRDNTSLLIVLNRLVEEKRYDDAYTLFKSFLDSGKFIDPVTKTVRIPQDPMKVIIEALYNQNTTDSVKKLKEFFNLIKSIDYKLNIKSVVVSALLLLQHEENDLAHELTSLAVNQNSNYIKNIKSVTLAKMKRYDESLGLIEEISNAQPDLEITPLVYPYTMKSVRESLEKCDDKTYLARFENLSKNLFLNKRVSSVDLPERVTRTVMYRMGKNFNRTDNNQGRPNFAPRYPRNQERFEQGHQELGNRYDRAPGQNYRSQELGNRFDRAPGQNYRSQERFEQGEQQSYRRFNRDQKDQNDQQPQQQKNENRFRRFTPPPVDN